MIGGSSSVGIANSIRPNKKINMFLVTGLKILGSVGTHIFFKYFFSQKKKNNFMGFERYFAFQNA